MSRLVSVGLLLSSCSGNFGLPDPASRQAEHVARVWRFYFLAALAVGALVWGLIFWAIGRYRRRPRDGVLLPSQRQYHVPLEILYTVVPVALVVVLFGVALGAQFEVDRLSEDPDLRVEVTGFQWQWQFHYPDAGVTVTGSPDERPTLVVPVEATVRITLDSPDVIHSFFVPGFLFKRDVIPGVTNQFDVTPTVTGRFDGHCAEFCGIFHDRMSFVVEVVDADEFEAWLAARGAAG